MTDYFESSPEESKASSNPEAFERQEGALTVELPPDIAAVIHQRSGQSGQAQTQVIVEILRMALSQEQPEGSLTAADFSADLPKNLPEELQQLQLRLTQLESLIPKLAVLEGKLTAF
jgi:hypothetical protein